jgi:polar amino acid transport system substrate-binding protein
MRKKIVMALATSLAMCTMLAGCGNSAQESTSTSASSDNIVYAVEVGSAGEAIAEEKGFKYNSVASQADALMEVASGTSDAAIIDLLMASAMTGEGTSYPDMQYTDELTSEEYGVGCRLGSDLASFINEVLYDSYADGTMQEIATTYGIQEALVEQSQIEFAESDESDVEYIKDKGTLIVGVTDVTPMDYKDSSDEWIGFDADMARLTAEKLGVDIKFVEIDWDNKIMELNSKNIDVVWNGMTLTNEVTESMTCSNPYCYNAQVIVVNK